MGGLSGRTFASASACVFILNYCDGFKSEFSLGVIERGRFALKHASSNPQSTGKNILLTFPSTTITSFAPLTDSWLLL